MSGAESTTDACPATIQFGEESFACELPKGHSGMHLESGVHEQADWSGWEHPEEFTYTIRWRGEHEEKA